MLRLRLAVLSLSLLFLLVQRAHVSAQASVQDIDALRALLGKSESFYRIDMDSVKHYGWKTLDLARRKALPAYIGAASFAIGTAHGQSGDQDSAIFYLESAFQSYREADSSRRIANVAEALSEFYLEQGRQRLALERLNDAMVFADSSGDSMTLAKVAHRMSSLYLRLEQHERAIEFSRKSLAINRLRKFDLGISVNLNAIGNSYRALHRLDSAQWYLLQSLAIKQRLKDERGSANVYSNLALVFIDQKDFRRADSLLLLARKIATAAKVTNLIPTIDVNRGYSAYLQGAYNEAIPLLESALASPQIQGEIFSATEAHVNLAHCYAAIGQYETAFSHLESSYILRDSMNAEAIATQFAGMQADLEARKQRHAIDLLNAQALQQEAQLKNRKAFLWVLGFIALLILAFTVLLWVRYRIRTRDRDRLTALNQLRSRFFGNIAHEFKTPLGLILGPLDKLIAGAEAGSEERVLYALMQRNARQLLDLNNQLLDLARLEVGRMELRPRDLPWEKTIRDAFSAFQPAAELREVELRLDIQAGDWDLEADRSALEKILNNLLSNAIKHTPGGGSIAVGANLEIKEAGADSLAWRDAVMVLIVEDSGRGIASEDLGRIFDRFYQVESARQAGTPGTGIGLALVRDLVGLMDGEIDVQSELGKGSRFSVRLPMRVRPGTGEAPAPAEAYLPSGEQASAGELPRLLIVEDNEEMREFMRREFMVAFEVMVAENGRIGLEMAVDDTPDIVISDLMMPEMDGIAFCAALKSNSATSHVPFILLTALGTIEDRVRGLETGADDYLQKPFHPGELLARARNLVEQRRQLRKLWTMPETEAPATVTLNRLDEEFLQRAMAVVREHMADPDFSVEAFSREMHMSRPQLFRKVKALTDHNLSEFIRSVRLKEAARLFAENFGNVTEVLYAVGFNNSSYFSKCFREMYEMSPSDYAEQFKQRVR